MSKAYFDADQPAYANATFGPPTLADPEDPHRVENSHFNKMELGKSSSSCKLSFVTRLHRLVARRYYRVVERKQFCRCGKLYI